MKKFPMLFFAFLCSTAAFAEPIFLSCTLPFEQKNGKTEDRRFSVSVDTVERTGHVREIDADYESVSRSRLMAIEPNSVTFVLSDVGDIIEGLSISRTDLSIAYFLQLRRMPPTPARLKGQCKQIDPPQRKF